jgi:hydroxymethylpyrimidine/phosphomethylpyrimidine kinase
VSWGIKASITNLKTPPDIIFHKGGFGKEAMVLIFGKNPADVLRKFSKISR